MKRFREEVVLIFIACASFAHCGSVPNNNGENQTDFDSMNLNKQLADCDCGLTSYSCVMDSVKGKLCECHPGYFEVNGYCTGCSCGENSFGCFASMYTARMCLCHRGYTSFTGYCVECFFGGDNSYAHAS
ncbi:hypothetical protein CDAR_505031 [Caerostris darwini]|uniref:Uncharacterized protein n=1 Tax=Caerostris darwini TaxID=1538125 RepID=A0AAV4X105_9ARAC|nr:hypothetical protein CDAR_505031 [Caerostris darwini]